MQNDVEELHYNPFASPIAGRRRSLSSVSLNDDPSFAAFRSPSPSYASRPFLDLEGSNHARVRTETDTGSRNSQYHHPLRSAGLSTVFRDAGITRPHLTRVLDNGRLVDVSSAEDSEEDTGKNEVKTDEKVVIVHEVTSKDSLAGVALKYGINLTELRRVNHLWASDSIHLRKVLYIPLEKSSPSQLHAAPIPSSNEPIPSRSSSQGPDRSSSSFENKVTAFSPPTIRRVPASELSFFPPPSKPSALAPSTPSPPALGQPSKSLHSRYATSPAPSLNTILTALPIAASTRDTIIARLSFDSTSSSYSDREREPYLNDHEGHELDDVQARRETRTHSMDNPQGYFNGGTQSDHRSSTDLPYRKQSEPHGINLGSITHLGGHGRSFSEEYMGPPPLSSVSSTRIRNIQLEPSPVMQIPARTEVSQFRSQGQKSDWQKGKIRPRLSSVNFDSLESLDQTANEN